MTAAFRRKPAVGAGVAAIVLVLAAGALVAGKDPSWAALGTDPEWGPQRAYLTDRDLGAGNPAWAAFLERHPGTWRARWDTRTGLPQLLWGPGIPAAAGALDEGRVGAIAFDLLGENEDLFGLAPFQLEGSPLHAGNTWYLNLALVREGIPLDPSSRVGLRIKDNGVVAAIKLDSIPKELEPATPTVPAREALGLALASLAQRGTADLRGSEPALGYLVDSEGIARLVWRFELRNSDPADPFGKEFLIRARGRAAALRVDELIRTDFTGSVTANAITGETFDPPAATLMRDARVTITSGGSGSAFTDAAGAFGIPGTGTRTIRSRMDGRWSNANNTAGSDIEESITAGDGDNFHFFLNTSPTEFRTAQTTAFYWTTAIHNWSSAVMGNNGVEFELPTNVNINSTCNAFWDGSSINFFRSGDGCPNTAHDGTVVSHEYGHGIDSGVGGILDGAYSEGFGDAVAMALTDQPCSGIGFFGPGTCLRNGNNVRMWPASECGGEVHCVGEVYAQFTWQMTKNLKLSLGDPPGRAVADLLVLLPALANPTDIPDAVLETFIADDDNGNINDGTPHFDDIADAAASRNLPFPDIPAVNFDYPGGRPDLLLPSHRTRIRVDVTANRKNPVPGSGTVTYRINGGAPTTEAMLVVGTNQYEAVIPRGSCFDTFTYYFSVATDDGRTATDPTRAPDDTYLARVNTGNLVTFEDDFQTDKGWSVENVDLIDGAWERGVPVGGGDRGDPPSDSDGSGACYLTNNTDGDSDVDGGPTKLLSPLMDFSAGDGTIGFDYWFFNDDHDDDFFSIWLSDDGGLSWRFIDIIHGSDGGDGGWIHRDLLVSDYIAPTDQVRVRFGIEDNPNDSVTEGGLDAVRAEVFACEDATPLDLAFDPLVAGQQVTFTVSNATPGSDVFILGTKFGFGTGPCKEEWGDLCADLEEQGLRILGPITVDGSGTATRTRTVPSSLAGRDVFLQAVNAVGIGGADSVKSAAVQAAVQ